MQPNSNRLWTIGRIAEHLGAARHRIEYIIDTRRITPSGRAGIARVFDGSDVELIAEQLRRIDAQREEASHA